MRDRERMDHRFALMVRPQEGAAARRVQPFVAITRVPVSAKRRDIEIDLARCVGSVDEYEHAPVARERGNFADRPDEAGAAILEGIAVVQPRHAERSGQLLDLRPERGDCGVDRPDIGADR